MEVELSPDQEALIRDAVASGRVARPEDAVQEALHMWEERERRRTEILGAVDRAESSVAAGKGRTIKRPDEALRLANDVKLRGTKRLARETSGG